MKDAFSFTDTIAAPATLPGTGAVSIIRVSGPGTFNAADRIIRCRHKAVSESEGYTVRYGSIEKQDGSLLDEVLVSVFRAPHSYTGEDSVEICCHASSFIVSEILSMLFENGVRMAEAGEFSKRAFLNGKMDLSQAEAVADLIAAQDAASHRVAIRQLKGGISRELSLLRDELLEMTSLMELELDFSEEDVEFADRRKLGLLLDKAYARVSGMADSFRSGNAIKNGIPVTIAGPANAGKSTLLNALVGDDRAIVSDIAGTTRDSIEESCVIDGIRFRFIDTAGIRETRESIEKMGIERTYRHIQKADVVLVMIDVSDDIGTIRKALSSVLAKTDTGIQKVAVLLNKIDTLDMENTTDEHIDSTSGTLYSAGFTGEICDNKNVIIINNIVSEIDSKIVTLNISAMTGKGLNALTTWLAKIGNDTENGHEASVTITNQRHYEALCNARSSLDQVKSGLTTPLPTDLLAESLRDVLHHIGTIIGEFTPDEVLGNIFKKFCIGK